MPKRNVKKIICKICNNQYTTVGFSTHLSATHNITTDDYVTAYGEFRKNKLNKVIQATETCNLCSDHVKFTKHGLTWHLKLVHNISKIEYIKANTSIKYCACGCGQSLPTKLYTTTKFLSGHNVKGATNPNYGKKFSSSTLEKMQLKARERMNFYRNNGGIPMHTDDAIKKRANYQTNKFVEKIEHEYNVKILERLVSDNVLTFIVCCNVCNNVFTQYHQSYFTCPLCNITYKSVVEREIIDEIKKIDTTVNILHNTRKILPSNKEIDIALPEYKIAIEFNGLYWHSELQGKDSTYHLNKTKECESIGYHLIHIFEDEWIAHKDIILDKIKALMKKDNRVKVFARKCVIQEVSFNETKNFLNTHHLQGADSSKHRYGLYFDDMLISVMTFSKPNASKGSLKNKKDNVYELSRFCTKSGYVCVGGASKLLKHFIQSLHPDRIISYADRRYSNKFNNVYTSLNFTLTKESKPSYWYFKKNNQRYHRFNFTKRKTIEMGGDPTKTEWENMVALGYNRIWDCGHFVYEMVLK